MIAVAWRSMMAVCSGALSYAASAVTVPISFALRDLIRANSGKNRKLSPFAAWR